ncbi:MAG: TIGR00282 family metallophosphoesterase [Alphaproteobacteria bacterium]
MKILFCGDIVGRAGREAVIEHVPLLRRRLGLDFVIVNGENAAHGFGITGKICDELFACGVDVITGGNHTWDKSEIIPLMDRDTRLLRPANFPPATPGRGAFVYTDGAGRRIKVINLMTRLFMELLDDPFPAIQLELPPGAPKKSGFDAVIVDVHGEATSEKVALGHVCDGRASLVVGTHTHIPTADAHILVGGTGYQTDAGMCGDYDSVIGMEKQGSINNFLRKLPRERLTPADGEATLCGVYMETDSQTGLARTVSPVRCGGRLAPQMPAMAKS